LKKKNAFLQSLQILFVWLRDCDQILCKALKMRTNQNVATTLACHGLARLILYANPFFPS
jgi:hypothetical protein